MIVGNCGRETAFDYSCSEEHRIKRSARWPLIVRTLLPALLVAAPVLHAQQRDSGAWDCQVTTRGGVDGLVMVQTNDPEQAERVAAVSSAVLPDGSHAPATGVVQCVLRGKEHFTDPGFRRFAENLPR